MGLQVLLQFPADHVVDDFLWSEVRNRCGEDLTPVSQNGHVRRDLENLGNPVGDVGDRHAALGETRQHAQQVVGLCGCERGRGLVENQDFRLASNRTGDFHELPERNREAGHSLIEVY